MKRKEIDLGAAFEKDRDFNDLKKEIFDEAMNVRIEYERENIIYIHQDSPHLREEE